jgi:hypothetical protein
MQRIIPIIMMFFVLFMVKPSASSADSNLLFILDGSNSMWGQVDGVAKIVTAKEVLSKLLIDLPPDTKPGLMAYGHRTADCTDVEVLSSFGADSTEVLTKKLNTITPKGKTPIGYSLLKSGRLLERYKGQNNYVVLVSDGIETCGGDPCKTAGKLIEAGVDVRVHVVGFDVNKDERGQLECIASAGNGRYFHASSTKGLTEAIAEVKREVQVAQVKPKSVKTEPKKYFFDDFDGDELKNHWEVINPNPDAFIVEDGHLMLVGSKTGSLSDENIENFLRLTKPIPKGDWVATVKFNIEYQTLREVLVLGLYDDKKNFLAGRWITAAVCCPHMFIDIVAVKSAGGQETKFSKRLIQTASISLQWAQNLPQPLYMRITKKGRAYVISAKFEGEEQKWLNLQKLTSLRAKGNLAFGFTQRTPGNPDYDRIRGGESIALVDWVKIETLE